MWVWGEEVPRAISFSEEDVFAYCSGDIEINLSIILTILLQQFLIINPPPSPVDDT